MAWYWILLIFVGGCLVGFFGVSLLFISGKDDIERKYLKIISELQADNDNLRTFLKAAYSLLDNAEVTYTKYEGLDYED